MLRQLSMRLTMAVVGLMLALSVGVTAGGWPAESTLAASDDVVATSAATLDVARRNCGSCWS